MALSGHELVNLKNRVVEDFDASNWKELGALTNMIDEVENHPRLLRSLSWGDPDYDGLALTFLRKMIGKNDQNLEVVKKYVDKICTYSGENISSEESEGRKIIFSPTIFDIPTEELDTNLVSVMMPFDSELSDVYKTIKEASKEIGLECK